jgi:hypothetical protein
MGERFDMRKYHYAEQELREAVANSYSIAQVLKKLDLVTAGGNYATIQQKIKLWEIDIQHFRGKGWRKGCQAPPRRARPLDDILTENSFVNTYKLKKRLILEGIKHRQCEVCHLDVWQGQAIPLELHHLNGIGTDCRLENLQLLCPNCHALTNNYRGKNKQRRIAKEANSL